MKALRIIVLATLLGGVAACGAPGSPCEAAVREAAEISSSEDTASDLDEAIETCVTLAEFEAAADQFPDALDGVSAREFISNRCAFGPAISASAICTELAD